MSIFQIHHRCLSAVFFTSVYLLASQSGAWAGDQSLDASVPTTTRESADSKTASQAKSAIIAGKQIASAPSEVTSNNSSPASEAVQNSTTSSAAVRTEQTKPVSHGASEASAAAYAAAGAQDSTAAVDANVSSNLRQPIATATSSSDATGATKISDSSQSPGGTAGDADAAGLRQPIAPAASQDASSSAAATGGTSDTGTTTASGSQKSSLGQVLKSNIIQTFELDPRLKKDITEGDPALRPIKFVQDYYTTGYNPTITWSRDNGPPWLTSYNTRAMALYLAGPVTQHLSGWFQMLPQSTVNGFFPKFELFQGMANYGTDKTFIQIRGGQSFNWENSGWGGADRTITQTFPGVYTPLNGFDPTNVSKTISLEATGLNWTTGKVFGYWQPAPQTSSDPNISYSRGEGVGLTFEKLIGQTGISGVQSNLTMGRTGLYNSNTDASGNVIGAQKSPFIRWTSWVNKSFQDRKGYVRLNPSFGLTVFHQKQYLDDPAIPENSSTGYGYTFDMVAIPVRSYWTTVLRYDQFRATNLGHLNTTYTFTVGNAFDFHTPNKGRIRITLDYQLIGQREALPSHQIILGFWPIW
jgi:hypothetical protein